MREVWTVVVAVTVLLVAAAPALADHTADEDLVPIRSFATTGPGWYAIRLDNEASPVTGLDARLHVSVELDPHTSAVVVASLWNGETDAFLGAVVTTYFVDELGLVVSSRTLGGELIAPLTPPAPATTVKPGFVVESCCGPRQVLISWASDAPIGAVRIDVTGNELVTYEDETSGTESFLVRNDEFGALAHAGADAAVGIEARAMLSGRATVSASAGEFFGFFLGVTELGDDPLVCDLRIIGPDLDVETQLGNNDLVCILIARDDTPGEYQLRVERFVAPNLFTGQHAQVLAVGSFSTLPAAF